MSPKRLFVEQPLAPGCGIELDGDAAHYLGRVLRARAGDTLNLFNGDGLEFAATVANITRGTVTLSVGQAVAATPESPVAITLVQAMSRNEKMDLAVQKAVELGVHAIRPVAVERSVMRLDSERSGRRVTHWRQVAISAAQQCGRAVIPEVHAPSSLDEVLRDSRLDVGVVADPAATQTLGQCLAREKKRPVASAGLLVGPEGGLTAGEIEQAVAAGWHACQAGPRVLRTETAALALAAVLQWHFGDLAGG